MKSTGGFMNRFILLLSLLLPGLALATSHPINCANTTLGQTYNTSAPSLALSGVNYGNGTFMLINPTAFRICAFTRANSATVAPTAGDPKEHCFAPGVIAFLDNIDAQPQTAYVYLRADQANCTSGIIDVDLY